MTTTVSERELGRFGEWYRRTPTALEFREGILTDRRLIWCFVGESFKSLLLRADMGARGRAEIAELSPAEVAAFDDRNRTIPLESLDSIRLFSGTRLRRARLTVEWNEEGKERSLELHNTSAGDPQVELVETLADDDRLAHVEIVIE